MCLAHFLLLNFLFFMDFPMAHFQSQQIAYKFCMQMKSFSLDKLLRAAARTRPNFSKTQQKLYMYI